MRQNNAHAWAEVYFDNVGWITFEPTPGYDGENGWSTEKSSEGEPTIYAPYGGGESAVIEDLTDDTDKNSFRRWFCMRSNCVIYNQIYGFSASSSLIIDNFNNIGFQCLSKFIAVLFFFVKEMCHCCTMAVTDRGKIYSFTFETDCKHRQHDGNDVFYVNIRYECI